MGQNATQVIAAHVLDEWFVRQVKPRMKGRVFLICFGDDFVIGCELEEDARRIIAVLPKRFVRFGLTIHPKNTVLVSSGNRTRRFGEREGAEPSFFEGIE